MDGMDIRLKKDDWMITTALIISAIYVLIVMSIVINAEKTINEEGSDELQWQDEDLRCDDYVVNSNVPDNVVGPLETDDSNEKKVKILPELQFYKSDPLPVGDTVEKVVLTDMLTASGVTSDELEAVLKFELKELAVWYEMAEKEYGVNAVYLSAISALESGWGRYQFRENNIFGFGKKEFESESECILYVAEFLKREYLTPGGMYYHDGTTLADVNVSYNGSEHWLSQTTSIAESIAAEINKLRERNQNKQSR